MSPLPAPPAPAPADLDGWARACFDAYADLTLAEGRLLHANDIQGARQFLHSAREEMWSAGQSLVRAGAARPEDGPAVPLPLLDTNAVRDLADALQTALDASARVDAERETAPAARRRTARLRRLLDEAELELYGPAGAGE